jgi:hypothetical protein
MNQNQPTYTPYDDRETPLRETVQLDQDETYHLFLVLQAWFTEHGENAQQQSLFSKDGACYARE